MSDQTTQQQSGPPGPPIDTPEAPQRPPHSGPSRGNPAGGTATVKPRTQRPARRPAPPRVDRLPPWRILLHNDDVNDMGYVVETIVELTTLHPRQALLTMLTAHKSGAALLMVTHRERAELLAEQFHSKHLTVSIEPES